MWYILMPPILTHSVLSCFPPNQNFSQCSWITTCSLGRKTDLESFSFNARHNAHEKSDSYQPGVLFNNVEIVQETWVYNNNTAIRVFPYHFEYSLMMHTRSYTCTPNLYTIESSQMVLQMSLLSLAFYSWRHQGLPQKLVTSPKGPSNPSEAQLLTVERMLGSKAFATFT